MLLFEGEIRHGTAKRVCNVARQISKHQLCLIFGCGDASRRLGAKLVRNSLWPSTVGKRILNLIHKPG
jgi:hypothetical protein